VTCYKNTLTAGSHTLFCDFSTSTHHCALVRYEVMPAETAQSAEWLRAVCNETISQSGRIQIFRRPRKEKQRLGFSVPSPTYTGGNLSQKMEILVVEFFKHRSHVWYIRHKFATCIYFITSCELCTCTNTDHFVRSPTTVCKPDTNQRAPQLFLFHVSSLGLLLCSHVVFIFDKE
jgi:hypothetical protein